MLQLARAEAGIGLARTDTDLVAITRLVVEDYAKRPLLASRLSFDAGPDQCVFAAIDPDALGISLHNLIDNALRHGSPDGPIEIGVGPAATVSITNDGPSVSPDELAKLQTRFERGGRKDASLVPRGRKKRESSTPCLRRKTTMRFARKLLAR